MKKRNDFYKIRIVYLVIILCFTIKTSGQVFNYHEQKLYGDSIKNKNSSFKLTNVNTLKYKVYINNMLLSNNTTKPDILTIPSKSDPSQIEKEGINNILNLGAMPQFDSDALKENSDFELLQEVEKKDKFEYLNLNYSLLCTHADFRIALTELIMSDLPTNQVIENKTGYFESFFHTASVNDKQDGPVIVEFYNMLIKNIKSIKFPSGTLPPDKLVIATNIFHYTDSINLARSHYKLSVLYVSINENTFTANSFIPKPNVDEVIINVKLVPKIQTEYDEEIQLNIPLQVIKGIKLDFSTGVFISNIANTDYLNNPVYERDSIIGYQLVPRTANPISFGLIGYLHAYFRNRSDVNLGGSLGIGFDQDQQFKFMPGLALIFGKKDRLILNLGFVLGKKKDLSVNYNTDRIYREVVEPSYNEKYDFGWGVGISYNLK